MLLKIAVIDHACQFDGAAQLQLPPASAALGLAEGIHETGGGLTEAVLRLGEQFQLFLEPGIGLGAALFKIIDPLLKFLERFANGLDGLLDGLLTFLEVAPRALLIFFK